MERWEIIERWLLVLVALAILAVVLRFAVFGYGSAAVFLLVPVAFWAVWQAFFEDKLQSVTPSSTAERILATGWLWFRRSILWAIGLPLSSYSAYLLFVVRSPDSLLGPIGGLLLGLTALWVGTFGAGRSKGIQDDVPIHNLRKKRYRW